MHETLREALALSPDHLSCYALIVEDGTPLCRDIETGKLSLPGDDLDREMYEICRQTLLSHGYAQYEISNFSLPGKRCRHNENCWNYHPYLGFGCAAHSFYNGQRRANPASLDDYLAGQAPQIETISAIDAMFEYIMLGLRLYNRLGLGYNRSIIHRRCGRIHGICANLLADTAESAKSCSILNGLAALITSHSFSSSFLLCPSFLTGGKIG